MKKFLIIRFSSIGDIVLTSPIVRCIKKKYPDSIIHYATKKVFSELLIHNPYIDQVFTIEKEIDEISGELISEEYDFVIDLHRNLRTYRLKRVLKVDSATFPKINIAKFLRTQFKIDRLPNIHIVDRYFKAVESLGVINDGEGLDYFIPEKDNVKLTDFGINESYVAFAIGAQFETKRMPTSQLIKLIRAINFPVVLLGGPTDEVNGNAIEDACSNVINLCGKLRLNQSASIIQQATKVISHDTGLMHIASAFKIPIVSIWGNTIPEFGMYPYLPKTPELMTIHEVKLKCRPCSKIGYSKCPKGHFNCMMQQNLENIATDINSRLN